jgi:glycosyltransferase involved in cell wall biosynthesis
LPKPDIVVVTVESTTGWGSASRELAAAFERAGADVRLLGTGPVPPVRTFMLTDLTQARAAARVTATALAERAPDAVVYCSITAALLWPVPGAIWVDALAVENRPGRHGAWQRVVERRRLRQARLVLTMADSSMAPLRDPPETVTVPVPVEPSGPQPASRDIVAVAYAGNPEKKRLDYILEAWQRAHRPGEKLLVAGIDARDPMDGVEWTGRLPPAEYRALLRRARVFVAAPRREDYGIAQLEALADGCMLVTTPAPGPYPALELARRIDRRLVDDDLARAIRAALDQPLPDYADRARAELAPFTHRAVDRTVAERVLPRLVR